jgi:NADH dehydrogenase FAD-containing subunit
MKAVIVGAGYAGLNAWHELRKHINTVLISDSDEFRFYSNIDYVLSDELKRLKFRE